MASIKNLIFDFGGVLLELDEHATYDAFRRLGLQEIPPGLSKANMDFQRGRISEQQFVDILKMHLPAGTTDARVKDAWCAMLGGIPARRMELLRELGKRYRLFLLSNTDDIHIGRLKGTLGYMDEFESLFEKVYYSQRTGYRKPEQEIFQLALNENGLIPSQTLFVDDVKENAEAAGQVGMRYFWLDLSKYTVLDIPGVLEKMEDE